MIMATQLISYYGDKKENKMNSEHGIDFLRREERLKKLATCHEGHDTRHSYSRLDEIKRLLDKVESHQCCGNCVDSYNSCPQMKEQDLLPFNSCEHWQWDNMTAAERIKG